DGLTRLMAPILSFTADELWRFLPGARKDSVHIAVFPTSEDFLLLVAPEPLRKDKRIGSPLQAKVVIAAPQAELSLLERYARELPMLFIVSEVELKTLYPDQPGPDAAPVVTIERADGVKCERCWRYVRSVSTDPAWAGICDRCQEALAEAVNG